MEPIRVILAEDNEALRRSLVASLAGDGGIAVVGEAENGVELLALCARHLPDVVVVDIRMPMMDGIEACRRLRHTQPDVRLLVLTTFDDDEYLRDLFELGIDGYLLKSSEDVPLASAIHGVYMGIHTLDRSITHKISGYLGKGPAAPTLTDTERRVAELIADGLYNKDIAAVLSVSYGRARNIVSDVYRKLGVLDRADLKQKLEDMK